MGLLSRQPGLPFPLVIYSFSPTSGAEAAFGSGCLRAVGWSWVKCVRPQAHREPPLLPHGFWGAAASRWGPGAVWGFRVPWSIPCWGFPELSSKSLLGIGQRASRAWGCSACPVLLLLLVGAFDIFGPPSPSPAHGSLLLRFPTPWCHRGPSGPGGCEATIAPFLVLLSWENLSHSWGKGNENWPCCSRRWMAGTAVNGGSNPGCGTSPNPCISRRAGLQVGSSSLKHSRQQVSMAGTCGSPCPSQIRAVSICGKFRASPQLSEGSSLWKRW